MIKVRTLRQIRWRPRRSCHVHMVPATGTIAAIGVTAEARDGVAIGDEAVLTVKVLDDSEIVLAAIGGSSMSLSTRRPANSENCGPW
jgi:hypothetical protein